MVDILCERTSFSNKDGSESVSGSVLLVNFRRLKIEQKKGIENVTIHSESVVSRDLFHSIAGLYSASLPDMELDAIYSTLTKPAQTIVAIATKQDVLEHRQKFGPPSSLKLKNVVRSVDDTNEGVEPEEEDSDDPYQNLFSDSESDDNSSQLIESDSVSGEHDFEHERNLFLEEVKKRQSMDSIGEDSIGIEERIIGCITFMQLSSKPNEHVSQILLLAVRHRWRGYGVGGYLIKLCMDPSIIGQYDMLLAYADHKAETFFNRYGFTDDCIVTARHRKQADYWENSTLMAYIPPYSIHNSPNSFKSVELLEEQLKKWRVQSIAAHCDQVCIMERLRQEILVLMARVTSQQEVIDALHKELRDSQRNHRAMEIEYEMYRLQTQSKLVRLMEDRARNWISVAEKKAEEIAMAASGEELIERNSNDQDSNRNGLSLDEQ